MFAFKSQTDILIQRIVLCAAADRMVEGALSATGIAEVACLICLVGNKQVAAAIRIVGAAGLQDQRSPMHSHQHRGASYASDHDRTRPHTTGHTAVPGSLRSPGGDGTTRLAAWTPSGESARGRHDCCPRAERGGDDEPSQRPSPWAARRRGGVSRWAANGHCPRPLHPAGGNAWMRSRGKWG